MTIYMTANINRHRKSRDMCWISINIHRKCCCCPSKSTRSDTKAIYFCKELFFQLFYVFNF